MRDKILLLIVPTLPRGNASRDALRHIQKRNAERPWRHSHAGAWERSITCGEGACSRWAVGRSCRRLRSFDLDLSLDTQLASERSQPRFARQLLRCSRAGASSLATMIRTAFKSTIACRTGAHAFPTSPQFQCGSGLARESDCTFNPSVTDPPLSRASSLPQVYQ